MLETLQQPKPDKNLSLSAEFARCAIPGKLNLGIGVFRDNAGNTPIFASIKDAEREKLKTEKTKVYVSPEGDPVFLDHILDLLLGSEIEKNRFGRVQSVGGAGALTLIARVLFDANPNATVYLPDLTWVNHVALFEMTGFKAAFYPYYNHQNASIRFEELIATVENAKSNDIFLVHGCCHNPTGTDLKKEQWRQLVSVFLSKGILPIVDIAYQGFGNGLEEDAWATRYIAKMMPEAAFAYSCSKNFGIYRDRVGLAAFLSKTEKEAKVAQAQLGLSARNLYSMPPNHGSALVRSVLADQGLKTAWAHELNEMRVKVQSLRKNLASALRLHIDAPTFDFLETQIGMFSLLPLSAVVIEALRREKGFFLVGDGRINMAGLTHDVMDNFAKAIAQQVRNQTS
ncbi:MAG: aromatic amino acid transaminase [Cohaesibacter sp.]|nr:aromatic amino acid transaminase [Cohaesibacter sp.]